MNWLKRLLIPPLALACVMTFFIVAQSPTSQHKDILKPSTPEVPSDQNKILSKPEATASQQPKGLLSDWRPDVDEAIDQLETWLSEEHPQPELNFSMANLAALYDTKLYLVFIDYLASLEPEQTTAVVQEQQLWLQLRKERTAAVRLTNDDRSLSSYNASETYVYITHERIDSLTALMQKVRP